MAAQPWEQSTDEQLRPEDSTADGTGARQEPGRVGQLLGGRFKLEAVLGRGAMGVVYRASDRRAGEREVALKLVLGGREGSSRDARFVREGELTARLDHPGIVRVHDAGELDGVRFLAYELVEGCRTLHDLLGDPATPRQRLVEVVRDAARALGHAHARGVLHRDVKPSNILVDAAGRTRVADFGLAAATGLERLTQTGVVVGTPTHMAPEQLDVDQPPGGPTTDVWALGVVLYQAITGGALPFDGATLMEVARNISRAEPASPRDVDPTAPAELSDMCLALLRRDPAERPADGEAVAVALDAWLAGRPVGLAPPRRLPRRALATAAAGLLLAAAIVAALRATPGDPAKDAELEVAARRLCASPAALGSDRSVRARLRDDVRAAPGGPARQAAAARLDALDALERAARGDLAGARALAEGALAAAPDVPGLGALGRALADDDAAAWDAALAEGWRRPEVRAARAVARVAAGAELEAGAAREALIDLEAAAQARGGSAPAVEHEARAAVLVALGRPVEALAALDAAGTGARSSALRWRVLAVAARAGLQRAEPAGPWLERLPPGAPPPGAAAEAARTAAAARAQVEAELRTDRTGDAALRPLVDRLRLARRLEPGRPLPPELSQRLVTATTAIIPPMASAALLHDVGELLGDDVEGLGQMVRFVRGMGSVYKSALTPYALRLWELRASLEPSRQVLLADSVGVLLREVGEEAKAEAVFDEGLRLCDDTAIQASLLLERGLTRLDRKDDQGALADADAGLAVEPALVALWSLRLLALRRVERKAEAFELACRLLGRPDLPQIGRADVDEAARHAWELGRQLDRHAELLPALEHYLIVRRDLALWSVRIGWLQAFLGDVEAARRYLTGAVELLRTDPQLHDLGGAALVAAAALGGEERVPKALSALVQALEKQRGRPERGERRDRD